MLIALKEKKIDSKNKRKTIKKKKNEKGHKSLFVKVGLQAAPEASDCLSLLRYM
jgi:hypothetical protein